MYSNPDLLRYRVDAHRQSLLAEAAVGARNAAAQPASAPRSPRPWLAALAALLAALTRG